MTAPVIVALDYESSAEALALVRLLGQEATAYKVGLQMLVEEGPELVRTLVGMDKSVFLDLKTHEIPNSVAGAVRAAGKLGVAMVTVHASGGSAVLQSAVAAAAPFPGLKVLALTVITSLKDADLPEIGLEPSVQNQVVRLAQLAVANGCHGVVASAHEAHMLVKLLPAGTLIVVPGIQLVGSAASDQARVSSPKFAAAAGATHIVVGRAVTAAEHPQEAFRAVILEFNERSDA